MKKHVPMTRAQLNQRVVEIEAETYAGNEELIRELLQRGVKPIAERDEDELIDIVEYADGDAVKVVQR